MFITRRGIAAISTVLLAAVLRLNAQSSAGLANTPTIRAGIASAGSGSLAYTVRTMPLEEYVAGVLAGEAYPNSSPAALEALAITIRTYAIANRGRHAAEGFDLCDLTHCQVLRKPTAATTRAAAATAGRILIYDGTPALVFYSALTELTLAGRPIWVREGAALYFAREQTPPDEKGAKGHGGRGGCPTDGELLQPSSPGALVLAYDRAASCFADRLRAGKAWRDIE
jgi:peptidoglycan hydrolase-like amidase